jgi:hypothetical protein
MREWRDAHTEISDPNSKINKMITEMGKYFAYCANDFKDKQFWNTAKISEEVNQFFIISPYSEYITPKNVIIQTYFEQNFSYLCDLCDRWVSAELNVEHEKISNLSREFFQQILRPFNEMMKSKNRPDPKKPYYVSTI